MATWGSKKRTVESEDGETKILNLKSMEIIATAISKAIKTATTKGFAAASDAATYAINAQ